MTGLWKEKKILENAVHNGVLRIGGVSMIDINNMIPLNLRFSIHRHPLRLASVLAHHLLTSHSHFIAMNLIEICNYIISVACGWFTVPFTLMNINFLHRFWSVRSPHKILSFSKLSFALKVAPYPIIMAIQWCSHFVIKKRGLAAYSACDNAFGKEVMRKSLPHNSEIAVGDVALKIIMYIQENDMINLSALAVLITDSTIMTVNFAIASILCYRTLRHIRGEITFSPSYKTFQFKILRALFAQSAIPVLCVYFPFGLGVAQPLLLPSQSKATFGPWFTFISSFPAMDALVIIWLMRDYRDGLLSIVFGKHWKSESVLITTQVNPLQ
uniref:G protein-coupled receptor n=1 Tax=Pristionchus pacificus TaxID=54126 RepID=A0A8R1UXQ0_PRIPA